MLRIRKVNCLKLININKKYIIISNRNIFSFSIFSENLSQKYNIMRNELSDK